MCGCVGGVRCVGCVWCMGVCEVCVVCAVCGVCGGSVQCGFHLGMMHMSASVAVRLGLSVKG